VILDQLMVFIWVSTPFCRCVFHVSEERTASILRVTEYGSGGCWSGWEERNVWVIWEVAHISFFPTTSASTWTRFSHAQDGGSMFFWNVEYTSMAWCINPKENISGTFCQKFVVGCFTSTLLEVFGFACKLNHPCVCVCLCVCKQASNWACCLYTFLISQD
jgi:hypothetical protein